MCAQFSAVILDSHIAPGASTFSKAEIPDMSTHAKESRYWVANYFLNCVLTAQFGPPMNAYAFNFLRRTQAAFNQHQLAREKTLAFLAGGGQSVTAYVDALFFWESFLGQSWHAFALLATAWDGRVFEKNDGSVEQRLNALYNQMKHVESRIENGQMIPGATVPVWLDDDGLRSIDTRLDYAETASVLGELAKYADILMNPRTAKEEIKKLDP
jgi:hypothetical protein